MQATTFEALRDLVLHHGARRGWRTQRHIAVICGLDESALSRFLNGEQDLGARRTHALFQAVGIPVEQYDLAYALLGRAQEGARAAREIRARQERVTPAVPRGARDGSDNERRGLPIGTASGRHPSRHRNGCGPGWRRSTRRARGRRRRPARGRSRRRRDRPLRGAGIQR